MEVFNQILNDHVLNDRSEDNKAVPESTEKSTIQMKHIKAHLDVIAVVLIITVSLYKIYDLSTRK